MKLIWQSSSKHFNQALRRKLRTNYQFAFGKLSGIKAVLYKSRNMSEGVEFSNVYDKKDFD